MRSLKAANRWLMPEFAMFRILKKFPNNCKERKMQKSPKELSPFGRKVIQNRHAWHGAGEGWGA
jgi:hypothetical protein